MEVAEGQNRKTDACNTDNKHSVMLMEEFAGETENVENLQCSSDIEPKKEVLEKEVTRVTGIDKDRDRLKKAQIFMNHSGAWGLKELSQSESRLSAVVARLIYLHSLAAPGAPGRIFCDAQHEDLHEAVRVAAKVMEREVADDCADCQALVLHVCPDETVEALQDKLAAYVKSCASDCVFYVLCGDSEVLPAPKTEEEETQRGLSALQVGMALTEHCEPLGFQPGPLIVAEFARQQVKGVLNPRVHISSHQLEYLCEGERCMQITETWKMYAAAKGGFLHFHNETSIGSEEEKYWTDALSGSFAHLKQYS